MNSFITLSEAAQAMQLTQKEVIDLFKNKRIAGAFTIERKGKLVYRIPADIHVIDAPKSLTLTVNTEFDGLTVPEKANKLKSMSKRCASG